jgi:hypothetical protein
LSADFVVDILVDELGLPFALVFSPTVLFFRALISDIFRRIYDVRAIGIHEVQGIGSLQNATGKNGERNEEEEGVGK